MICVAASIGLKLRIRELELEYPLLRFVSAEATEGMAAALDMAPEHGKTRFNDMELSGATARDGAKALRKQAKAKRDNNGWTAVVYRAGSA